MTIGKFFSPCSPVQYPIQHRAKTSPHHIVWLYRKGFQLYRTSMSSIVNILVKSVGMLRAFPLVRGFYHLSVCPSFNLPLCSTMLLFHRWVRFPEHRLPSIMLLQTQTWIIIVPWDWIKLQEMLYICSGLVLLWCMHTRMSNSGILFSRYAAILMFSSFYVQSAFFLAWNFLLVIT